MRFSTFHMLNLGVWDLKMNVCYLQLLAKSAHTMMIKLIIAND